ncbi:MAG: IspD/TarI family cytidylyltransferase [Elusimicrobiota bacterium]
MQKSVSALIMAAGEGSRFGSKKQFLKIGGRTLIGWSVSIFDRIDEIISVIIVYPPDMDESEVRSKAEVTEDNIFVKGASRRDASVAQGLKAVNSEYVIIHDAVRPLCSEELARRVIEGTLEYGTAIPAVNPVSTTKYYEKGKIRTIDRDRLYLVQTPQGYRTRDIIEAYSSWKGDTAPDSSTVAENAGIDVKIIKGERENIKITVEEDFKYAKYILEEKKT